MTSSACDQCSRPVKGKADSITCMAFCEKVFHLSCTATTPTKLNPPFVKIVHENPNLMWMCDDCAKLMKMAKFKSTISSFGETIDAITAKQESAHIEIRKQLNEQAQQIAELSKCISTSTPTLQPSSGFFRPPPRKRRYNDTVATNKPLLGGSKAVTDTDVITVPEPIELFWVYLSRIHPSVKPEAVEKLVKDCLQGADLVKAIPLVKRGAVTSRMSFVSYKVGVDPKFREMALREETWPEGILFREFEDLAAKNLWQPQLNTPTIMISKETGLSQFSTPVSDEDAME